VDALLLWSALRQGFLFCARAAAAHLTAAIANWADYLPPFDLVQFSAAAHISSVPQEQIADYFP
jgi:hypothetical protein